jgi:hypothetical protein
MHTIPQEAHGYGIQLIVAQVMKCSVISKTPAACKCLFLVLTSFFFFGQLQGILEYPDRFKTQAVTAGERHDAGVVWFLGKLA